MTAPHGFVEATLSSVGETLAVLIAVDQIAAIKKASSYGLAVKCLVVLRSGEIIQLSTPFGSFVERISQTQEKDSK